MSFQFSWHLRLTLRRNSFQFNGFIYVSKLLGHSLWSYAKHKRLPMAGMWFIRGNGGSGGVYLDPISEESNIGFVEPIEVIQTGKQGWPCKNIKIKFLKEAMSTKHQITLKKLAKLMGIHRNTLSYYLQAHRVFSKFSSLSNFDLDILVKTFQATKPDSGSSRLCQKSTLKEVISNTTREPQGLAIVRVKYSLVCLHLVCCYSFFSVDWFNDHCSHPRSCSRGNFGNFENTNVSSTGTSLE